MIRIVKELKFHRKELSPDVVYASLSDVSVILSIKSREAMKSGIKV
jgi:hypothetical protein